ncbi:MAG: hypothetical protein Q8S33_04550 [Myxococcales bacterium]|nr:hypothetical protein [Myxococcales bacterium]MDP3499573.1 hypothetical protein [Myxococcales bacterium]
MTRRFLLLALVPFVGLATTQIPHTVPQRAMASDRVAVVEVIERKTVSDPADPRRIKTHTQLQVRENVRGTGPSSVTLVQLGGTLGQQSVIIPGDAEFTIGERALVFLHCTLPERCYLVAMGEGKLPIVDTDKVVVHDMVTDEFSRRALRELIAELRALPPGKVLGPGAAPGARR